MPSSSALFPLSWPYALLFLLVIGSGTLILAYLAVFPSILTDRRRKHLPPGPKGLPLIGNWHDLRDADKFRGKAIEWAEQFGGVFHVNIGGSDYVFLSSPAGDVASAGRRQLFMPYGPHYRVVRRISHDLLNSRVVTGYRPIQDLESKQLLFDMMKDPGNFYYHNRRYSASVIITATYGHRIDSFDHPLARKIYSVVNNMQLYMEPGAWLVDSLPALKSLPQFLLGNWRDFGRKCFEHDSPIYLSLWENLKKEVRDGTARDCFCKRFLENDPEKQGLDNLQAAYQAGGLVEAGSETTSAFLNTAILQLAKHSEAQLRAQQEIDAVVGPSRLPSWDDEASLPYLRAIIKETLRMRPPNKFGINHYTTEDDFYNGMFIPKGTTVTLNWWAINYSSRLFDKPYEFRPERYLNHEKPAAAYLNIADPDQRDHWSYGAGRRVCPGVHLAESSLFLNLARFLWGFSIGKKTVSGQAVEPSEDMVKGWMCIPGPFECAINVRSEKHAAIIESEWKQAEAGIDVEVANALI